MAATVCALPVRVPVEALASCTGRTSQQQGAQVRTNVVRFPRAARMPSLRRREGRRDSREAGRLHICFAEGGGEGKSCCGGGSSAEGGNSSGSSSSGGKCSSHGSISSEPDVDVSGIGKEFEALVAQKTMAEFEAQYETGQMKSLISRDVIDDVVNIYPDAASKKNEEKFLDIDELLAEARSLSTSDKDFVFDADFEEMLI